MLGARWLRVEAAAVPMAAVLLAGVVLVADGPQGRGVDALPGVLDEHPLIAYASRPTSDRVARLGQGLASHERSLTADARTGYLAPLLDALNLTVDSQLLVFSKTGVQRDYSGPRNPRAIFFDRSVAVGYIPGAPKIEIAAHDPQQGVVFYTLDQRSTTPRLERETSCLLCHVTAATLDVPGLIARSNAVGEDGNVLPQLGSTVVSHETPHPERWGGWFVTSNGIPAPYSQRAHEGNITFTPQGHTSNQVFIDWLYGPDDRRYLSRESDIVALLMFDHQARAINLLTRLNWEARIAGSRGASVESLSNELAEYLLFVGEAPISAPLTARPAFAERFAASAPNDHLGRSCAQFELETRLLKYPCSYMLYSEAFSALPDAVRQVVYRRISEILSTEDPQARAPRVPAATRRAALEILRDTRPGFPKS